jgi:aminocarboxymuconate-semialdehyde decarboxylase
MIVDFHAHLYSRAFMEEIARVGGPHGIGLVRGEDGVERLRFEGVTFWAYEPSFWDVRARLASLDAAGVDLQVLSMGPPMVYWAEPAVGLRLCRILNDSVAEVVAQHPTRFAGLIALPFQAPRLALEELERARQLGLVGVAIGSNIHGRPLDDPDLWPIYERIASLDLPLFVHPINPLGQPAIHDYRLDLTVGFPFETTLAAARLVFGGVLERFTHLRVCLAHLGGALPFLQERLDIGWRTRQTFPGNTTALTRPPSDYFRRFFLDCVSYSDPALVCALALYGADHLVLGSDAPFAVGDLQRSVDYIRGFSLACESDKQKILGGTAARLLKLPVAEGS